MSELCIQAQGVAEAVSAFIGHASCLTPHLLVEGEDGHPRRLKELHPMDVLEVPPIYLAPQQEGNVLLSQGPVDVLDEGVVGYHEMEHLI